MNHIGLVVLYVEDLAKSKAFYEQLFDLEADILSENYTSFPLSSGMRLSLWRNPETKMEGQQGHARHELGVAVDGIQQVDTTYDEWQQKGVSFEQAPKQECYGYTFIANDIDGHRIRVFAMTEESGDE